MTLKLDHTAQFPPDDGEAEYLGIQKIEDFKTSLKVDEMLAYQGVLPQEHPLSSYAQGLFMQLANPGEEVEVLILESSDGINAFATEDNRIVLTRELLEFCESDEELLYVMQHELNHLRKQHISQRREAGSEEFLPERKVVTSIGFSRITELLEADMEGLLEMDRRGINIAGAISFVRRLGAKEKGGIDLEHGTLEDRLMGFRAMLLLRDLNHFNEDRCSPKPDNLKDAALYKSVRGFPLTDKEIIAKDEVWLQRNESIKRMNVFELRKTYRALEAKVNNAKRQNEELKARKSGLTERITQANNKYFTKAEPLLAQMKAFFIVKAGEEGIDEGVIEATDKLNERMLGKIEWDQILGEVGVRQAILTIKEVDLMKWGAIFKESKHWAAKLGEDFTTAVNKHFTSEEERFYALQILSLLFLGKWHEEKKVKKTKIKKLPEGWTEDEMVIIDSILRLDLSPSGDEEAHAALYEAGEDLEDMIVSSMVKNWEKIERRIMARGKLKAYSEHFRGTFEVVRAMLRGGSYETYLIVIGKIFTNITDVFEQNCLIALVGVASTRGVSVGKTVDSEESKRNISWFLAGIKGFEAKSPDTLKESSNTIVENVFANGAKHAFQAGTELLAHAEADSNGSKTYTLAFFKGWLRGLDELTLEEIEALDDNMVLESKSSFELFTKIKSYLASNPKRLVNNQSQLSRLLDKLQSTSKGVSIIDKFRANREAEDDDHLAFYNLLKVASFDFENLEDALLLLRIALWAPQPMEAYALEQNVWDEILERWERKGWLLTEVLEKIPEEVKIPFEVMTRIAEEHTKTEEELKLCNSYFEKRVKNPLDIGKAVVIHDTVRNLRPRQKGELLKALLKRDNDDELKEILLRNYSAALLADQAMLRNTVNGDKEDEHGILKRAFFETAPDVTLRNLYASDLMQRRMIVHLLLTGEGGLLRKPEEMEEIIDQLFDEYVDQENREDVGFINDVKRTIKIAIREARPEDVYLVLLDLFANRILQAPYKDNWTSVKFCKAYRSSLTRVFGYEVVDEDEDIEDEDIEDEDIEDEDESVDKAMELTIYGKMGGVGYGFEEERKGIDQLITRPRSNEKMDKMDAVGLLLELAQSLKSIGTRGLQVADMYLDLPPKYRDIRSKVYSDMEGQSKLTAYDTIVRNIPEDHRRNLRLGRRIGGGAMVTVYPFESDSMEGVVKVINPNIETFTATTFSVLERTFAKLIFEDPEHYGALGFLLRDIRWWVLADMDLAASSTLDEEFTAQNNGFTVEGSPLAIAVPEVKYRDKKCIIETRLKGASLDRVNLEERPKGEALGLIRANVRHQVIMGVMHSDVHPGNIQRDPSGRLGWLDRTLLLKLRPKDQTLLLDIETAVSDEDKVAALVEGLLALPENIALAEWQKGFIREEARMPSSESLDERIKHLSVRLRRHEYFTIPPHLTLVFKSLLALNRLGERIGKGRIES